MTTINDGTLLERIRERDMCLVELVALMVLARIFGPKVRFQYFKGSLTSEFGGYDRCREGLTSSRD